MFKNGFSSAVILLFTVRYKSKVGKNNSAWDIYMHEYMFFNLHFAVIQTTIY